jgi:signal transduction histidine kinase
LDYVDRVTAVASAPTYCWVESAMGHGIVGGSLKDQTAEVAAVAGIALRVLNGEAADSIPLSSPDLSARQLDWRQLRRWGISEARVPAGTLVRFREPGLWDRYKAYIVGAAALLVAQSALIAGLLLQLAARRRAEATLQAIQDGLRASRARVLDMVEQERNRIARDLHDDIGQRLAALTMALDDVASGPPVPAIDLNIRIDTLSTRSLELAKDVQIIARNMHFSRPEYLGLESACADFCRDVSKRGQLAVDFDARDVPEHLDKDVALCVYRVLQESVNNAAKHARAPHVRVALSDGGDQIRLEVADDGIGFDPATAMQGPGLGLISMQERVRLVSGELSIVSRPGAGATIRACVSLVHAPAASEAGGRSAEAIG